MAIDWHRGFEYMIFDLFTGTPFDVDIEPDLSLQQQFLDVVVIRKRDGELTETLPDGFSPLVEHNLISFKSREEAFDDWTMNELIGHYVSYRKMVSPSTQDLLPEEQFQLFGVMARFPELLSKKIELKPIQDGVYDCLWGSMRVRLIVIRQLPEKDSNIPLYLFSPTPQQRILATSKYRPKDPDSSSLVRTFLIQSGKEDSPMLPPKLQEFVQDIKRELIDTMTPEEYQEFVLNSERFRNSPAEERLRGLPAEERLRGLPAEEIIRAMQPEAIQRLLEAIQRRQAEENS